MIEVEKQGLLTRIYLNRPERANALTWQMLSDLREVVLSNGQQHALVISGRGKVFSAGADLNEVKESGLATAPEWEALSKTVSDFPGLSIAALNGTLAGGAFGMALACDLRFGVEGMNLFYPVLKNGVMPQFSDPKHLGQLIGPAKTKALFLTGQKIDAETALRWGLIDRVVASNALENLVQKSTEACLKCDSVYFNNLKRFVRDGLGDF